MATLRLLGEEELRRKLRNPTWAIRPMRKVFDSWRLFTEGRAKDNTPVWRGQLRRSITGETQPATGMPETGRVGTNSFYAPSVEGGTGVLADLPGGKRQRYFPPPAALDPWAKAHGTTGGAVAMGIYLAGGTKPKRFLRNAAAESEGRLTGWLQEAARDIERAAGVS